MKYGLVNSFSVPSSAVGCWRTPTIQCTLQHDVVVLGAFGGNLICSQPHEKKWDKVLADFSMAT